MVQLLVSDLAADFGRARTKQFVIRDKHGREVRGVDGNLAVLKLYLQVVKLDTAGPIQTGNQLSRPIQAGAPPSGPFRGGRRGARAADDTASRGLQAPTAASLPLAPRRQLR